MPAKQRRLFEETVAEDAASLQAQLDALQGKSPAAPADAEHRRRTGSRCQTIFGASNTNTSPKTPVAPHQAVAGRWCASAKT
jgi:hypothetical protein